MTTQYFHRLARYNRWMNGKIYAICASMTDAERKQQRSVPFGSLHGVLNHLLLADRIWLGRFGSQPFAAHALDQELYSDFSELRREREKTDEVIEAWIATLDPAQLAATLTFTPMSLPGTRTQPLWWCVQHLFNHQTHHRGQLTALIELAGYDCGVTDILAMPETW